MNQKRLLSAFLIFMSFATFAAASEAIDAKYRQIGAATLGKPAGAETRAAGGGRVRRYTRGAIYWSLATGAHALFGPIHDKYKSLGAEGGKLGYPVTDVDPRADGGTQTLFRHGFILGRADDTVTASVMSNATYTANSVRFEGVTPKMMSPTEAIVPKLPQSDTGFSYRCECVITKTGQPGTGGCDLQLSGTFVRCAKVSCINDCKLTPIASKAE